LRIPFCSKVQGHRYVFLVVIRLRKYLLELLDGTDPYDQCNFSLSTQANVTDFLSKTSKGYKSRDCDDDGFDNFAEQSGLFPNGKQSIFDPLDACSNQIFSVENASTYTYTAYNFSDILMKHAIVVIGKNFTVDDTFKISGLIHNTTVIGKDSCDNTGFPVTIRSERNGTTPIFNGADKSSIWKFENINFVNSNPAYRGSLLQHTGILDSIFNELYVVKSDFTGFNAPVFSYNFLQKFEVYESTFKENKGVIKAKTLGKSNDWINMAYNNTFIHNSESIFNFEKMASAAVITINNCHYDQNEAENGAVINVGQATGSNSIRIYESNFTSNKADKGGAVYIADYNNMTVHMHVSNATGNEAEGGGGFAYFGKGEKLDLEVEETWFIDNAAVWSQGGAFHFENDSENNASFLKCQFNNNTAGYYGGSIYFKNEGSANSVMTITDSAFSEGRAESGGALYFEHEGQKLDLIVSNSTFLFNKVKINGGALYVNSTSGNVSFFSRNNTYDTNEAMESGAAVYISKSGGDFDVLALDDVYQYNIHRLTQGYTVYIQIDELLSIFKHFDAMFARSKFLYNVGGAIYARSLHEGNNRNLDIMDCLFNSGSAPSVSALSLGLLSNVTIDNKTVISDNNVTDSDALAAVYIEDCKHSVCNASFVGNTCNFKNTSLSANVVVNVSRKYELHETSLDMRGATFNYTTGGRFLYYVVVNVGEKLNPYTLTWDSTKNMPKAVYTNNIATDENCPYGLGAFKQYEKQQQKYMFFNFRCNNTSYP